MSEGNKEDKLINELIERRQSETDAFKKLLDQLSQRQEKIKKGNKKKR